MALLSLSEAKAFAGLTTTDVTRDASLQAMVDEVCDAVKRWCNNGTLESTLYTQILNGPTHPALILPFTPVVYDPADATTLQIYLNQSANGNPALFTADTLLTPFTDYVLETGPDNITTSNSGIVRFINGIVGYGFERPIYSLAVKVTPSYGAVKVVYTAGYAVVPPAIKGAINLAVRKMFNARRLGVPVLSESLNSYSYSAQSSATADGLITGDPTIRKMLAPFMRPQIGGYY